MYTYMYMYISVFDKLIWHTILFGTAQFSVCASGTVNYDYIVTALTLLLIGLRCIPNSVYTNYC